MRSSWSVSSCVSVSFCSEERVCLRPVVVTDDVSVAACLDCVPSIDLTTCTVNHWQRVSTGLGDDFQIVSGPASFTGRDIRSGNPNDVTEVRLPSVASAQPIIRLTLR